jgi:outer membrane protein OmpA-like peptidoglycan-associated protein
VDPERLESRKLAGGSDVRVLSGERGTSYVAPAGVLFDSDRYTLRPDALSALRDIARRIRVGGAAPRLLVEGHTDDRGDEAYGLELSRRRASAVAAWLVAEAGFEGSRIRTRGYGEAAPAVPNTSEANRQRNRRVVITVLRR